MSIVRVPLTQGKVAIIDAEDAERVLAFKWVAIKRKQKSGRVNWYAWRARGSYDDQFPETVFLHDFLMSPPEGMCVDHKDGDGLNCRRSTNLRNATWLQNFYNRVPKKTGRFFGVQPCSRGFIATISHDYESYRFGPFETEEEAARAYDDAARRFRGEFAVVNFPEPGERGAA